MRTSSNRVKHFTRGTVHFAVDGRPCCGGAVRTGSGWLRPTIEDVSCQRCIAMFGADEVTDLRDPILTVDSYRESRAEARAIRQARRRATRGPGYGEVAAMREP